MGALGPSTSAIMLRLVLVSLAAASAMETKEQLMKELSKWNNDVACWGMENMMKFELSKMQAVEECGHHGLASSMVRPTNPFNTLPGNLGNGFSGNSNPFNTLPGNLNNGFSSSSRNPLANLLQRNNIKNSAKQTWNNLWGDFLGGRSKRATDGLLEYDEEAETEKFIRDFDDFKHDMASNLANLTCVLTKLNMLDSSLQVNLKAWTNDMWEQMDLSQTVAGQDSAWRNKMVQGYTDCYQIASNWPEESLNKNPVTKVFGRHMIFFKCAMKNEKKNCMKAQMYKWLTFLYGNSDEFDWSAAGFPSDKYDRAALSMMVQTEAQTDEEKFIGEFFTQDLHM